MVEEQEFKEEDEGNFKEWLQDNIRIILSVLIVVAIAAGIYSYSKRTDTTQEDELLTLEEGADATEESEEPVAIVDEKTGEEVKVDNSAKDQQKEVDNSNKEATADPETQNANVVEQKEVAPTSVETGEAFVEKAQKGEGKTHLARRAFKNYLEKNADPSITAEHKIYVEDYLQKKVGQKAVHEGTEISFSKTLIEEAANQAKSLNEGQLKNLEKYSARVSNL